MSSSVHTLAFRFRHGSQAIFVWLVRGWRRDGNDGPRSEPELVPSGSETGAGRSLRNSETFKGNPLSLRDGRREDIVKCIAPLSAKED